MGCLTVGVVTKPFGFEGRRRMQQATDAISNLRERVDTLIIVSNDKLLQIVPDNTPLQDAFSVADDILRQGVVGISEIIVRPGLINVDFADVRSVMADAGSALMGIGTGSGKTRAQDAAVAAISSPLLDFPIEKAKGIVFNITGGHDMTLHEINSAAEVIYEAVDPNANIIFGALVDDNMENEISITVVATGFSQPGENNLPIDKSSAINLTSFYQTQTKEQSETENQKNKSNDFWEKIKR
jgi:cell division protein FtsZ